MIMLAKIHECACSRRVDGRWAKYFEISSGSFGSSCNTRYVTDWKATSFELWAETINQGGQAAIASPCLLPPYSCTLAFLPLNSTHPPMQSPVQQNQKLPEERRRCAPINETWSNLIWASNRTISISSRLPPPPIFFLLFDAWNTHIQLFPVHSVTFTPMGGFDSFWQKLWFTHLLTLTHF